MPPDRSVEQPTKIEFVFNLKSAKQIGLTIPPNVLVRADKVIKYSNSMQACRAFK
jgi:putative ABC transport system substrate-binding protein